MSLGSCGLGHKAPTRPCPTQAHSYSFPASHQGVLAPLHLPRASFAIFSKLLLCIPGRTGAGQSVPMCDLQPRGYMSGHLKLCVCLLWVLEVLIHVPLMFSKPQRNARL